MGGHTAQYIDSVMFKIGNSQSSILRKTVLVQKSGGFESGVSSNASMTAAQYWVQFCLFSLQTTTISCLEITLGNTYSVAVYVKFSFAHSFSETETNH